MIGCVDAHHHLWDLETVHYPWLMARGVDRFFGDPTPIQRDYLLDEFRSEAAPSSVRASVHIQVGAENGLDEARWVQSVADANPDWPMAQVVFCDLTSTDLPAQLDRFQTLPTVRGVRQIVGRAPGEDAQTGTNTLLDDPRFLIGLQEAGRRGLSFDLQLIPELIEKTARILARAPNTRIALCHAGSPHDRSAAGLNDWAQRLHALSDLPHVSCKLSGLGMFDHKWTAESVRPIVDECLAQFGANRVMFGSNFPVDKLYGDYASLMQAYHDLVPAEVHSAVFSQTAARFYDLELPEISELATVT
ncbi:MULTISPECIES: amidohydrolase [unclassified Ruegeria]|uniref:amidohydrolase family protein n=1 Tax=unclassified Ruegeria TaxID=2625375 RepID=UPI001488C0BF|nr:MULTISPECIES: amidohydrolase family protein [unclassified Ruegeria]NOD35843.1 amidohydrolase family protein [Ruegeria sp. HKCCD7296]NOD47782.1 amidohydrolase family protein [Ruegeria sp. HKCCD5849]NOD52555.1 amidohydrolase family protein [Ruegeria sp. HKCCD5851]NOD65974.1 amidohydrolase family protein [Ruegeria sp. HKCCD7303]NOE34408.1 amidohydrolase family protein [Ruegeria sp. HKCCD7318]